MIYIHKMRLKIPLVERIFSIIFFRLFVGNYRAVKAINSTAVQVWWKPPNPQQINGINQGYKIQAWKRESSVIVSIQLMGHESSWITHTIFIR
jgi:hypothetical protein